MTVLVAGIDASTQACKVVVCDADTGAVVREGRAGHPDGTEIASLGDNTLAAWDTKTGMSLGMVKVPERMVSVAFQADGSRLVLHGNEGTLRLLDAEDGKAIGHGAFLEDRLVSRFMINAYPFVRAPARQANAGNKVEKRERRLVEDER